MFLLSKQGNSKKENVALGKKEWDEKCYKWISAEELESFITNVEQERSNVKKVLKDMDSSSVKKNEKKENPSLNKSS